MTYDFRFASGKKPLYGHVSPDTAYVQDDYPHGFRDRCKRRTWLEFRAKQGWRIVHQTSQPWYPGEEPPKDSELRWAKPKASTYAAVAACMYLDTQDHVQWDQLHYHATAAQCASFMSDFPDADHSGIKLAAFEGIKNAHRILQGTVAWVVNGQPQAHSDSDLARARKELGEWLEVASTAGLKLKPDFLQECKDLVEGKIEPKKIDPEQWKADMKQREDAAAAARAEKAENTKGALTAGEFVDLLNKKIDPKDRVLRVEDDSKYGYVSVRLHNSRKGEEVMHRDFSWYIDGFDRRDPSMKAVKVKLEERNNGAPFAERAKWKLRGKTGTPQQIGEYLAKHIHRIIAELEPISNKTASYDRSLWSSW